MRILELHPRVVLDAAVDLGKQQPQSQCIGRPTGDILVLGGDPRGRARRGVVLQKLKRLLVQRGVTSRTALGDERASLGVPEARVNQIPGQRHKQIAAHVTRITGRVDRIVGRLCLP